MKRLSVLALLIPPILCAQSIKIETDPSSIEKAVPGAVCEKYEQGMVLCQNNFFFVALYEDEALFVSVTSVENPKRPVVKLLRTIANGENKGIDLGDKTTKAIKSVILDTELHCGVTDQQKRLNLTMKSATIYTAPFASGDSYFIDHEDYVALAENGSAFAHAMWLVCPKERFENRPVTTWRK